MINSKSSMTTIPSAPAIRKLDPISAFIIKYGLSCTAATVAESATYPLDLTKTRLQISTRDPLRRGGLIRTTYSIARKEGLSSLWTGLTPAIYRHYIYTGVRIGLYELIRDNWLGTNRDKTVLWKQLVAGLASGCVGQFVSNPADLIKVQMQIEGLRARKGLPPRFTSTWHALVSLYRANGIKGLWLGWVPNCQRAALLNMADLATYDRTKHWILDNTGMKDNWSTHVCASSCSSLAAATVSTPADVVKTRVMDQIRQMHDSGGTAKRLYTGSFDCLKQIIQKEGVSALYRGFLPTYIRMLPWSLTFWVSFEKIRQLTGAPTF
ncbi:Cht-1 [Aphelenchoides bicaudatus]|nr:Cht-1 [Aphelenchoides bicaudatus]